MCLRVISSHRFNALRVIYSADVGVFYRIDPSNCCRHRDAAQSRHATITG